MLSTMLTIGPTNTSVHPCAARLRSSSASTGFATRSWPSSASTIRLPTHGCPSRGCGTNNAITPTTRSAERITKQCEFSIAVLCQRNFSTSSSVKAVTPVCNVLASRNPGLLLNTGRKSSGLSPPSTSRTAYEPASNPNSIPPR